jgi:hypothetical protein
MSRLFLVRIALLSLVSSTAVAQQSSPTVARARRLTKYFKNAHGAVVNGGMRPYAKVTHVGVQGRVAVGAQAGVTLGKVVDKGRATPVRGVHAGISFGAQTGLGPEVVRMTYVGKQGMTGREVLPKGETFAHGAMIGEMHVARSKSGVVGSGAGVSTTFGGGVGVLGRAVLRGKARKTPMLQHLEEGLKLSKEVNAAIRSGKPRGLSAKLTRLQHLHSQVKMEKQALNRARVDAVAELKNWFGEGN